MPVQYNAQPLSQTAQVDELRMRVRELEERERKESKKLADEDALRKIRVAEETIEHLQKKLAATKQVFTFQSVRRIWAQERTQAEHVCLVHLCFNRERLSSVSIFFLNFPAVGNQTYFLSAFTQWFLNATYAHMRHFYNWP